jgi:hypothetical protein
MKRKAVYIVLAVWLLSWMPAYGVASSTAAPGKKITLKFVDQWKQDHHVVGKSIELFNEIGKRSKERLEIIRVGGPEVIPAAEQLTYCGKGAVDTPYQESIKGRSAWNSRDGNTKK